MLVSISCCAQATPSKIEAEKWYKDFRAAKDKVFDGSFVTETNEHLKLTEQLNNLTKRAAKLFGEPMTSELANCTVAAINLRNVWNSISGIVRNGQLENRNLTFIATTAWSGGENYPTCLNEIDKLK
jgi:hypothetical protein